MPPSESTATSVVPPPMSTTIEPVGSPADREKPCADRCRCIGSSIRNTRRAPAESARFLDRAALHRRRARRHADDDHRVCEGTPVVHLADEVLAIIVFRDLEIRDHAVAHRRGGGAGSPRCSRRCRACGPASSWRRCRIRANLFSCLPRLMVATTERLIEHDAPALDVDQRVRGPQVRLPYPLDSAPRRLPNIFLLPVSFPVRRVITVPYPKTMSLSCNG